MRKLWIILGMLFVIGCSQASDIIPQNPAQGAERLWLTMYTVDSNSNGIDEMWVTGQDFGTQLYAQWQVGIDDFLSWHWTSQHNAIVWTSLGQYCIVTIRNDGALVCYGAPQGGWNPAGVWYLIDDNTSVQYESCDTITNEGMFIGLNDSSSYLPLYGLSRHWIYPDGAASLDSVPIAQGYNNGFTCTFDKTLSALATGYTKADFTGVPQQAFSPINSYLLLLNQTNQVNITVYEKPQIIVDDKDKVWLFSVEYEVSTLWVAVYPEIEHLQTTVIDTDSALAVVVLEIEHMFSDYNAVCNYSDNTIHFVIVEQYFNELEMLSEWKLVYYRIEETGLCSSTIIDSWQYCTMIPGEGDADMLQYEGVSPQITIRNDNICVVYTESIPDPVGFPARDLRRMFLKWDDYDNFLVPANWVQMVDLDGSLNDIKVANAPGNHPEF